jgi:hypothetical protein
MQQITQLKSDLDEVLRWTNWIEISSRTLSFARPPLELLVLFVVQSVNLAHSLVSFLGENLPQEILDAHIRGYLLDRVWSYHLASELIQRDVRKSGLRFALVESNKLLRVSRRMVARAMLRQNSETEGTTVRARARRDVIRNLDLSARK